MKTIPFYIIILILIFTTYTYSQYTNTDQVHLINREKYTGTVIEQKPGEYITILSENGKDTLTFQMDEIDKIVELAKNEGLNLSVNSVIEIKLSK